MSSVPALVAIDLGAESCRVSLLQWREGRPHIAMVRRFANAPQDYGELGMALGPESNLQQNWKLGSATARNLPQKALRALA